MNPFFNNLSNRVGQIAQNGLNGLSAVNNTVDRGIYNGVNALGALKNKVFPTQLPKLGTAPTQQAQPTQSPYIPKLPLNIGAQYGQHLQQVRNAESNIGSFKKGGEVKKTGNYKLHKGEFVVNPRLAALIKSGEGPKLKGYAQTHKTVPKLKYNREKSLAYREKTGFYKTKIDGGGHDAGYKWAMKQFSEGNLDPKTRKIKLGKNSPSFDEGFKEARMRALNKKIT